MAKAFLVVLLCSVIVMSYSSKTFAKERWDLLTIESIQCVKPAGGLDGWILDGLDALTKASKAVKTSGLATGQATVATIADKAAKGSSMAKDALEFLDSKFSGQDDLIVRVNGETVLPTTGDYFPIEAGETIYPDIQVSFSNRVSISLAEYDSGSDNDDLGDAAIESGEIGANGVHKLKQIIVKAPAAEDGSIYYITARVNAGKGNPNSVPQWLKCGTAQCVTCPKNRCEEHDSSGLDRDGDYEDLKACPPGYNHFEYQKYPQSWPFEDVYLRICKSEKPEKPEESEGLIMERWTTQQGGFWDKQQWMTGDFNGDGHTDFAKSFDQGGWSSIDVHVSNGRSFSMQRWATQQGWSSDTQQWVTGDFNGDGLTDIAKSFKQGGLSSIDVHVSDGRSFEMQRWATGQGWFSDTQQWVTGDFNGDGYTDIAKAFNQGGRGSIDVHVSDGRSFKMQRWATGQGAFWDTQQWLTGDFNGDGLTDIGKAFNQHGLASIDVHVSDGRSFSMQRWTTQQGWFRDAQQWMTGDFNDDGYTDFAKVFNHNGRASIDTHMSTGRKFNMQRTVTRQGGFWDTQQWLTGDFNGDGYADFGKAFNHGGRGSIDVHLQP